MKDKAFGFIRRADRPPVPGGAVAEKEAAGKTLVLPLKAEYFDAIRDGTKTEEYRLFNDYWHKRLVARNYDRIVLTKGYPRADDRERRLERPWRGYEVKTITHPHFGEFPVSVFAIDVAPQPPGNKP